MIISAVDARPASKNDRVLDGPESVDDSHEDQTDAAL